MTIPKELKYTQDHEWVKVAGDEVIIGITEYAQEHLGDITYVEVPEEEKYEQKAEIATIESVKAASDVYAPISGTVTKINEDLEDSPELINSDPYGAGWLCVMNNFDAEELSGLMSAEAYEAMLSEAK